MKFSVILILIVLLCTFTVIGFAQKSNKKLVTFEVIQTIDASAEKVWQVVAEDFGNVYKSHHGFISSEYRDGHNIGKEGALRMNYLNEEKSRYIKEVLTDFNPSEKTFNIEVLEGKGLPLASGINIASYQVKEIDDKTSQLIIRVRMRSEPAIFSSLFKGKYKDWMENYAIGVTHYTITGEEVSKENFKSIKKKYK